MDLAAADAADALFAACRHEELKISVLVNNAGIYRFGETLGIDNVLTE